MKESERKRPVPSVLHDKPFLHPVQNAGKDLLFVQFIQDFMPVSGLQDTGNGMRLTFSCRQSNCTVSISPR